MIIQTCPLKSRCETKVEIVKNKVFWFRPMPLALITSVDRFFTWFGKILFLDNDQSCMSLFKMFETKYSISQVQYTYVSILVEVNC